MKIVLILVSAFIFSACSTQQPKPSEADKTESTQKYSAKKRKLNKTGYHVDSTAQCVKKLHVKWDERESNVDGYVVYYGKTSGGVAHRVDVGKKTDFRVPNIEPNKDYFVDVRAYRNGVKNGDIARIFGRTCNQVEVDSLSSPIN